MSETLRLTKELIDIIIEDVDICDNNCESCKHDSCIVTKLDNIINELKKEM